MAATLANCKHPLQKDATFLEVLQLTRKCANFESTWDDCRKRYGWYKTEAIGKGWSNLKCLKVYTDFDRSAYLWNDNHRRKPVNFRLQDPPFAGDQSQPFLIGKEPNFSICLVEKWLGTLIELNSVEEAPDLCEAHLVMIS